MVNMKTSKCPTCGGIVFKLAGKASKLCHDECMDCRDTREEDRKTPEEQSLTEAIGLGIGGRGVAEY